MRYRLRTLLLLTTLIAMALSIREAWRYHQWKTHIPVVVATEIPNYTFVPKHVRVRYGKQAERWLKQGMDLQVMRREAPVEKVAVASVIAKPFDHQYLDRDNFRERLVDPERLAPALIASLHEPAPPNEESNDWARAARIEHAELLMQLGHHEVCFDWAVEQLRNGKHRDGKELELLSLNPFHKELEDSWLIIQPYLVESSLAWGDEWAWEAEEFCMQYCRDEFLAWCKKNLNNKELGRPKRENCFLALVRERPSLELLKAAKPLFIEPEAEGDFSFANCGRPALSELAAALPTKECHTLIAEYAYHRAEIDNDDKYEDIWKQYADESWRRSVVEQDVADGKSGSLYELSKLSDDVTNELLFEYAVPHGPLRRDALRLLIGRFKGKSDPRVIKLLADCFHEPDQLFGSREHLLGLIRMVGGLERAMQLRKEWEQDDPSSYFRKGKVMHENGLTLEDLLKTFRSAGFASGLTAAQVRQKIVDDPFFADLFTENDHPSFIRPGEELEMAITLGGLKQRVTAFTWPSEMLTRFSKLSRGELQIENISEHEGLLRFGWDGKAFEIRLDPDACCFEPDVMAEMLNSILERFGHKYRFLSYSGSFEDAAVFFGDPHFAKHLHEEYGVQWKSGVEAYWAD